MEDDLITRTRTEEVQRRAMAGDEVPVLQAEHMGVEYFIARSGERYRAIKDITMSVPKASFTAVVGPSGCGKSTFLKAVAGLIPCTHGRLLIDGNVVDGPGADRAVVFQSPALLPWRDVLGNVMYGLDMRRVPRTQALSMAHKMIDLVGLSKFTGRYPRELSGGMQQRVNLARALAVDPKIMLLDEPFSALDAQTRETMQYELLRIWEETRKTALFITHEISEAVFLADRVAILSKGPASVVTEMVDVPLARPRTHLTKREPLFFELVDHIWDRIKNG
jgi:NitT/TauT family transport system ATP-binding protein